MIVMLNTVVEKLRKLIPEKSVQPPPQIPDISRVIQLNRPGPSNQTATEVSSGLSPEINTEQIGERAEAAVADLSDQFSAWMLADLAKLEGAWSIVQSDTENEDSWKQLFTCAHNIRGVAGSYGYPAVSRLCGSLCALLDSATGRQNPALINLHVRSCRSACDVIGHYGNAPTSEHECEALEEHVRVNIGG